MPRLRDVLAVPLAAALLASCAAPAAAWECVARGRSGVGWGVAPQRPVAEQVALAQCAARSGPYQPCRVIRCSR